MRDEQRTLPMMMYHTRSLIPISQPSISIENPVRISIHLNDTSLYRTRLATLYCVGCLSARRGILHHLSLLLLKSLTDSLRAIHVLLDAAGDAAGFALDEGFGCEVIDTGVEAVRYEV